LSEVRLILRFWAATAKRMKIDLQGGPKNGTVYVELLNFVKY